MKQKKFLLIVTPLVLASLLFTIITYADNSFDDHHHETFGKTFFNPRSPTLNKAQESSGVARFMWPSQDCAINGFASVASEFAISFNKNAVGQYIFFNGSSTMKTGTAAGPGVDIFGENFLLNDNFTDAITANPQIKTEVIDFSFYAELNSILDGLYVLAHVPICWAHWSVDFTETVSFVGTTIGAQQLGNLTAQPAPFNSLIEAWNGQATFGDIKEPMNFARVDGVQKKFKGGDVEIALGYTFIQDDCNYVSLNARGIIPTSNRPDGVFLFEPCTGNFHHYEVGFGILAGSELWYCDNSKTLHGFINANLYHPCSTKQRRTFDLIDNGPGSRYLLFKRFDSTGHYAGEIVRGPNILTLDIKTHNMVHGDAVFMLDYNQGGFNWNIGYNLWGRTKDQITLKQTIPDATFGIAGLTGTNPLEGRDRTASQTTISGANATADGGMSGTFLNNVYLTTDDIDINSAAHPGCFTHGIFTYIGYVWDCYALAPFIGLGTEVEFSGSRNDALRMWHVWGKFGLSF